MKQASINVERPKRDLENKLNRHILLQISREDFLLSVTLAHKENIEVLTLTGSLNYVLVWVKGTFHPRIQ